jgi:hypothetical protein
MTGATRSISSGSASVNCCMLAAGAVCVIEAGADGTLLSEFVCANAKNANPPVRPKPTMTWKTFRSRNRNEGGYFMDGKAGGMRECAMTFLSGSLGKDILSDRSYLPGDFAFFGADCRAGARSGVPVQALWKGELGQAGNGFTRAKAAGKARSASIGRITNFSRTPQNETRIRVK